MLFFIVAAVAAYLLTDLVTQSQHRTARTIRTISKLAVCIVAVTLLFVSMFAVITESPKLRLPIVRHIATAPEMIQAIFGFLAGMMLCLFARWRLTTWRLIVFAGAFGIVVLAALVGPYMPGLLSRLTGFETPYAKFQFAVSQAEKQLDLEVRRDLGMYEGLDGVVRTDRIIQLECGFAALKAGGFAAFEKKVLYRDFRNALRFRQELIRFLSRIANAEREGYDLEGLRRRVSPIADKMLALVSGGWSANKKFWSEHKRVGTIRDAYLAVMDAVRAQHDALEKDGIGEEKRPQQSKQSAADPPCKAAEQDLTEDDVRGLLERTRYVHAAAAVMSSYTGNIEGTIKIYRLAEKNFGDQINVAASLAEALYGGEREFREVSEYFEKALRLVESEAKDAQDFSSSNPKDSDVKKQVAKRYERARLNMKTRLAYLWAQEGVRLLTADQYASEAYDDLRKGRLELFACLDDYESFFIRDTYAFVKLSSKAHTGRREPGPIREARWILDDLRAELQNKSLWEDRIDKCFYPQQTKLWLRRVNSHLRMAESMLRQ